MQKYADYINVDTEYATLEYKFVVRYPEIVYNVWYQFSIRKVIDESAAENKQRRLLPRSSPWTR